VLEQCGETPAIRENDWCGVQPRCERLANCLAAVFEDISVLGVAEVRVDVLLPGDGAVRYQSDLLAPATGCQMGDCDVLDGGVEQTCEASQVCLGPGGCQLMASGDACRSISSVKTFIERRGVVEQQVRAGGCEAAFSAPVLFKTVTPGRVRAGVEVTGDDGSCRRSYGPRLRLQAGDRVRTAVAVALNEGGQPCEGLPIDAGVPDGGPVPAATSTEGANPSGGVDTDAGEETSAPVTSPSDCRALNIETLCSGLGPGRSYSTCDFFNDATSRCDLCCLIAKDSAGACLAPVCERP
jgi:hypothetical protein